MATMNKVRLPDNTEVDIQDKRIEDLVTVNSVQVDSVPTTGSTHLVTSGGVKEAISGFVTTDELETALDDKQDTLVSGTNVKTVNTQSLLGSGNIALNGGNINYTGEDGEMAVTTGDTINSCLSGLDSVLHTVEQQKEDKSNKVTSLSSSSTDTQYPSAKCVYDIIGNIETLLAAI